MSLVTLVGGAEALLSTVGSFLASTDEERNIIAFVVTELEAVKLALNGDITAAVDKAFDGVVLFSTEEDLAKFLTSADVRRAKIVKEAADAVKFGFGQAPDPALSDP